MCPKSMLKATESVCAPCLPTGQAPGLKTFHEHHVPHAQPISWHMSRLPMSGLGKLMPAAATAFASAKLKAYKAPSERPQCDQCLTVLWLGRGVVGGSSTSNGCSVRELSFLLHTPICELVASHQYSSTLHLRSRRGDALQVLSASW